MQIEGTERHCKGQRRESRQGIRESTTFGHHLPRKWFEEGEVKNSMPEQKYKREEKVERDDQGNVKKVEEKEENKDD
jgi:hypothetical protein